MTRTRVFGLRLVATVVALLGLALLVRLLWYPGQYAPLAGVDRFLLITAAVCLVVGPGLSTLVYKPGKPRLLLDLGVLAAVEVAVLGASLSVLHERRPVYTVFAVDRFEVVTAAEIDRRAIAYTELLARPEHEPRLVYAELPTEPGARSQLIDDVFFRGKADVDRRPEYWKPYAAGIPALKARARPLHALLDPADARAVPVQRWLARRAAKARDYLYLPLRGRRHDATMVVHADIGFPVAILPFDPW